MFQNLRSVKQSRVKELQYLMPALLAKTPGLACQKVGTVKACMDGFLLTSLCLPRCFLLAGRNLVALPLFSLTTLPAVMLIVTCFL